MRWGIVPSALVRAEGTLLPEHYLGPGVETCRQKIAAEKVVIARHQTLLQQWRKRQKQAQQIARQATAEGRVPITNWGELREDQTCK